MPYLFTDAATGVPQNLDDIANELRQQIDQLPPTDPQQLAKQQLGQETDVAFLVVVRGNETPHIHPESDLTFSVLEGGGYLELQSGNLDAPAGMTIIVPQGTCHAYYNTSPTDSVLIATFSPPSPGRADCP
ncbi:MAG TPA: cupin domain-containing protein [Pyrinomonadaceae bacterium]